MPVLPSASPLPSGFTQFSALPRAPGQVLQPRRRTEMPRAATRSHSPASRLPCPCAPHTSGLPLHFAFASHCCLYTMKVAEGPDSALPALMQQGEVGMVSLPPPTAACLVRVVTSLCPRTAPAASALPPAPCSACGPCSHCSWSWCGASSHSEHPHCEGCPLPPAHCPLSAAP